MNTIEYNIPTGTIWDAVQITPVFRPGTDFEVGRGSFQVGDLTIFATSLRAARQIAAEVEAGRAEFEFPEVDPAEADPTEAEPATVFNIIHRFPNGKVLGDGFITAGYAMHRSRFTITEALEAKVKMEAHNPGHTFEIVADTCPLHGADCEAWS